MRMDLNSDIGESFGAYRLGLDSEIMKHVTSVNIACGWHAGDPLIMDQTVKTAHELGVRIGAHPGYPDLLGFGRRPMTITPAEAAAYTLYQLGALDAFAIAGGEKLRHLKLHGAFYNAAAKDAALAGAVIDAMRSFDRDLILVALSGSTMAKLAKERGIRVAQEVFADRGYQPDGSLVPRDREGAFVRDPKQAIARVVRMATEGMVTAVDGTDIPICADTVCVHGDNPQAVEFVRSIRLALEDAGVEVQPFSCFVR